MIAGPSSSRRNARDALHRSGDQRLRAQLDRKSGEVHLGSRPRQAVGIVEHEHAELLEPPPEVERRVEAVPLFASRVRVVAQEDHVEIDEPRVLARGLRARQRLGVGDGVAQTAGLGAHHLGHDVGPLPLRERVDRGEGDVVPAPVGRERQVQGRVARSLRSGAVDDEAEPHEARRKLYLAAPPLCWVFMPTSAKIPGQWPVRPFRGLATWRMRCPR